VLVLVAAAIVVLALVAQKDREGPDAKPLPAGPLRALAAKADRTIGTAVDADALRHEPGYRTDVAGQFSTVTPENEMKWAVVEPSRGDFHWGGADRIVDFARGHDQQVRGHTLVWYSQNPGWLDDLPAAELRRELKAHIGTEMGRYKGRIADWDVVNEPIADDGSLRPGIWLDKLGPSYIADALRWAHEADPHARLWINEIAAEGIGPKSDRLLKVVRSLKAEGVPLDGVGFQGHFTLHGVPPTFRENLRRFTALGLKVAITELDVALQMPASDARLRAQAGVYADAVGDCLAVDGCTGATVWGFTDRHSWIPATQPGRGAATLLDDQLRPKPAYDAVAHALRQSAR
jgi:endo-1,4-beta-xylanase